MRHTLELSAEAEQNIKAILEYISARSPEGAVAWGAALETALKEVRRDPLRFAVAPEWAGMDEEVRQAPFSTRKGGKYRAIFRVSSSAISILHVRAPGQKPLNPSESDR